MLSIRDSIRLVAAGALFALMAGGAPAAAAANWWTTFPGLLIRLP